MSVDDCKSLAYLSSHALSSDYYGNLLVATHISSQSKTKEPVFQLSFAGTAAANLYKSLEADHIVITLNTHEQDPRVDKSVILSVFPSTNTDAFHVIRNRDNLFAIAVDTERSDYMKVVQLATSEEVYVQHEDITGRLDMQRSYIIP